MKLVQNANKLVEIINLESQKKDVFVVGVCGLGGAGKTTLCRQLIAQLSGRAIHLEGDVFAKYGTVERRKRIQNALDGGNSKEIEEEENPCHWYDWNGIEKTISSLKERRSVLLERGWNQKTGKKDRALTFETPNYDHAVIIVDCIYLLHLPVREWLDKILFIDTPKEITHKRGKERDQHRHDPEYRAYKEWLTNKYDIPYFKTYGRNEDWIMTQEIDN